MSIGQLAATAACPPFLRWAGSKRQILPELGAYWQPQHKRYLEPFAGSACLFFSLNPPSAILGDLNADLISTFLNVKYRVNGVIQSLAMLRSGESEYRQLRSMNPDRLSNSRRAARFIYLNRFCFNGLYRTNLKGEFNVPYGGHKTGSLPSADVLKRCSRRLQKARLVAGDFEKVLRHAQKGDFIYMDPPYAVRARRVFNEYDPATFSSADVQRLRFWMERLAAKHISFVVSYAESDEAELLRRGFDWRKVSVRRSIAGFARQRRDSSEILISNI